MSYSVYQLIWDILEKKNLRKIFKYVGDDSRVSDDGLLIAIEKITIPNEITDFVNTNFNNLFSNFNTYGLKVIHLHFIIMPVICIETVLTETQTQEIMSAILLNCRENYYIYSCSNEHYKWLKSLQ
jgi:hypothetical protein